jgi:hypothetical protein
MSNLNKAIWKGIKALQNSSKTGRGQRYMTEANMLVVSRCFGEGWYYSDNVSQKSTRSHWLRETDSKNR